MLIQCLFFQFLSIRNDQQFYYELLSDIKGSHPTPKIAQVVFKENDFNLILSFTTTAHDHVETEM